MSKFYIGSSLLAISIFYLFFIPLARIYGKSSIHMESFTLTQWIMLNHTHVYAKLLIEFGPCRGLAMTRSSLGVPQALQPKHRKRTILEKFFRRCVIYDKVSIIQFLSLCACVAGAAIHKKHYGAPRPNICASSRRRKFDAITPLAVLSLISYLN